MMLTPAARPLRKPSTVGTAPCALTFPTFTVDTGVPTSRFPAPPSGGDGDAGDGTALDAGDSVHDEREREHGRGRCRYAEQSARVHDSSLLKVPGGARGSRDATAARPSGTRAASPCGSPTRS